MTRTRLAIGLAGAAMLLLAWGVINHSAAQQAQRAAKDDAKSTKDDVKPTKEEPKAKKDEAKKDDARPAEPAKLTPEERAIRAAAEKFVKAFNAGDARAATAQYLPNAEYVNSEGESFQGREAIEKDMAEFFKQFPKAQMTLDVDSVRFVGPRVAIEEGRTSVTPEPGKPGASQTYISVDVFVDGEWKLGSVRETAAALAPTPHDRLEPLAWLIGDWIDESIDGIAESTCRWTEDGNYILQDFRLKIAGRDLVSGQQRIGWDPLTEKIKSWVFDSSGGHSEALWTWDGSRWIVKANGVRPDGTTASATNFFTPRDKDSYVFQSTTRISGADVEPDVRVVVVRRPPAAGGKDAKTKAAAPEGTPKGTKPADKGGDPKVESKKSQ